MHCQDINVSLVVVYMTVTFTKEYKVLIKVLRQETGDIAKWFLKEFPQRLTSIAFEQTVTQN